MTFDVMDQDGNGSVTREELKSMLYGLGEMVSDEYIEDMITKADTNRDGKI
jgi:Ca2+-binding EF-hand superfamily protein